MIYKDIDIPLKIFLYLSGLKIKIPPIYGQYKLVGRFGIFVRVLMPIRNLINKTMLSSVFFVTLLARQS
jgi:hypothetical protein